MSVYSDWAETVKAPLIEMWGGADWRTHGGPSVIPSNVPPAMQRYVGQPAALYDNESYVELGNAGYIDIHRPQVAANSGKFVFVLAPDPVIAAAPKTMTALQTAANFVFTHGDNAADALNLPSLDAIEDTIKGVGKQILIGVAVTIGVTVALKMVMGRKS